MAEKMRLGPYDIDWNPTQFTVPKKDKRYSIVQTYSSAVFFRILTIYKNYWRTIKPIYGLPLVVKPLPTMWKCVSWTVVTLISPLPLLPIEPMLNL
jgi:hypothetical protein